MVATGFQQFRRPESLFGLFAQTTILPGVGGKVSGLIEKKMGGHVIDLLRHLPVGVIDRSQRPAIPMIEDGGIVTLEVTVTGHDKPPRQSKRPWRVTAENDSGNIEIIYFHTKGDYVEKLLPIGSLRIISGRAERFQNKVQMPHPDHVVSLKEAAKLPGFEPIYPLTAGLTARTLNRAMGGALERLPDLPEWIPEQTLARFNWPTWKQATLEAHKPIKMTDTLPGSPARARLAYDELLANQLALALVRQHTGHDEGRSFNSEGALCQALKRHLPFTLTSAQERVFEEICTDQMAPTRMLRLVQGDVGSGKTLVALMAILNAVETGAQGALLAPTEILARQHYATLKGFLEPLGKTAGLLLGKMKVAEKKAVTDGLADGSIEIVVGTHALLSESVTFHDLGIAVVDEQQRFGVRQRLVLGEKGRGVDVLVMTATPIPRTLAMTAYGDLQSSQIDEKPPGRKPVKTRTLSLDRLDDVITRLKQALASGKQAYWICPLVDESDHLDIAAAQARHVMLQAALPESSPSLVHSRMDADSRNEAMEKFRLGDARLLVATTVIEVGVDVREASIIIIEHAERFGLAQMHQLRGRVGRGDDIEASCLLLYKAPLSGTASARLKIMRESNDGFRIAEEDLKLRGPGELLGKRQSGDPDFVLADLAHHADLLMLAGEQARNIVESNPSLEGRDGEHLRLLLALFDRDRAVKYLAGG